MESVYDKIKFYKFGKEEKEKITERVRGLLAGEKRVLLALIFGSFIRRSTVRDIDLCIYSTPTLDLSGLLSLNAEIEYELGLPVDLVELMYLPPLFRLRVLENGILVKGNEKLFHQLTDQTHSELSHIKSYSEWNKRERQLCEGSI